MSTIPSEVRLLDHLKQLEGSHSAWMAVHVYLSIYSPERYRPSHLLAAQSLFSQHESARSSHLFVTSNDDLIYLYKSHFNDDMHALCHRLQTNIYDSLANDLSARDHRQALKTDEITFAAYYDLSTEYKVFIQHTAHFAYKNQIERAKIRRLERDTASRLNLFSAGRGQKMTPAILSQAEDLLKTAGLANILNHQPVCKLSSSGMPRVVMHEVFVAINELRQTLMPQFDLLSNQWLFQYLTEKIDQHVLSLVNPNSLKLMEQEEKGRTSISLNINIATILSPEFLDFDAALERSWRRNIILEIQKNDILSDLDTYSFARDFAHDRSYRICIDGITHQTLPFIFRKRLGADLIKLQWHPAMAHHSSGEIIRLGDFVQNNDPERVILCHCDDGQAISYGQSLGVSLFQGHHISDMAVAADEYRTYRNQLDAEKNATEQNITDS